MKLGPVMFDLTGTELMPEEIELLQHPATGGVILFSRNYYAPLQLRKLIQDIRSQRPNILIAVDQEGGRVQRFQKQFTMLPPLRTLGKIYDQDPQSAKIYAETFGWVMASELRQFDIDFSFTPVLDLDFDHNDVIGDRALHSDPYVISELASYLIRGINRAGMMAVGKHFPGHGYVAGDSHYELPVDHRTLKTLEKNDLIPFENLIQRNALAGIMPAHVIYSKVDKQPAGFSEYWLKTMLREKLGFKGIIFSDSLTMAGAESAGSFDERAIKSMEAGCDMVLVCNHRLATWTMLDALKSFPFSRSEALLKMRGQGDVGMSALMTDPAWQESVELLNNMSLT